MLSVSTASALDTYFLIRIVERILMNARLFLFLQTIACANTARSQNRRARTVHKWLCFRRILHLGVLELCGAGNTQENQVCRWFPGADALVAV